MTKQFTALTPDTRKHWMTLPSAHRSVLSLYNCDVTGGIKMQRLLIKQAKANPAEAASCARMLVRYIKNYKSAMLHIAYYNLFNHIDLEHFRRINAEIKKSEAFAESCGVPPMFVYPIGPLDKIPQSSRA